MRKINFIQIKTPVLQNRISPLPIDRVKVSAEKATHRKSTIPQFINEVLTSNVHNNYRSIIKNHTL